MSEHSRAAARKIATMLKDQFGIEATPFEVRAFIKTRWDQLAPLAHIVHEAPDETKSVGGLGAAIREQEAQDAP